MELRRTDLELQEALAAIPRDCSLLCSQRDLQKEQELRPRQGAREAQLISLR